MRGYVELFQLGKTYETPKGPAVIVENFDLNIAKGEFVALLGHSGCGKSTVLSMVAGLNSISQGDVALAGQRIVGAGPDRGVVFQAPCLLPWLTAYENIALGVDRVFPHASRADRKATVEYYLELVGLADAKDKRPAELSLGMQQRVGLARAFALSPKMLLLDEPFGMLDSLTRMELQEILIDMLQRDGKTALMVTHDVDEALFLADRIVMMTNGPRATVGEILEVPFERPRSRAEVLADPRYYEQRERVLAFLEEWERKKHSAA
ncbi:MAG TPA: nitrate ABC transporter ATP-binding protein [Polyangiaceae bacterium]|nr:nitrate ABC transporter ATP-binding protein [Polyangiaceae bacterium]